MIGRRIWFWLILAAILVGSWARFYQLGSLPPQAWVDEVWYNLRARDLLLTGQFHIFYPTFWGGMLPMLVDLTALVQALGLQSLVASRVVPALAGVITLPLAYACLNELFRAEAWPPAQRRLTASLTALILSTLLMLVATSRVGYEPALIPPLILFYLWQVRAAIRSRRWTGWLWSGLALGSAQYVNQNGRFFALLAVLLAVHDLCLYRGQQRRAIFAGLSLTAGTAFLVALPLLTFYLHEPAWLLARAQPITVGFRQGGAAWLIANVGHIAAAFNFVGDWNLRQNLPGRPIFDGLQSLGLWVGIIWAVRRVKSSVTARVLLLWLLTMTASSLITDDAPQFERMIGVAAPAAALVAIGWVTLWAWLNQQPSFHQLSARRLPLLLAGLLVVTSVSWPLYDYFVRYAGYPGLADTFTHTPVALAEQLIQRATTESVFVERISEAEDVFAFDYLFPGSAVHRLDFRQCLPLVDGSPTATTYLLLTERDADTLGQLKRWLPAAQLTSLQPESAALMGSATLAEVPPNTPLTAPSQSARADFAPGVSLLGYEWSGPTVRAGESLFLTLYWKAKAPVPPDITRFVHLTSPDGTQLIAQNDGQPCQGLYPTSMWTVNQVVPDGFAITIPAGTAAGVYNLMVGWYHYPSLERLALTSADQPAADNRALIGTLEVVGP